MKNKIMFWICLGLVLYGGIMFKSFSNLLGIIIIGIFSYLAGVFGTKANMEVN